MHASTTLRIAIAFFVFLGTGTRALGQEPEVQATQPEEDGASSASVPAAPGPSATESTGSPDAARPSFVLGGYAEAFYQWNFARPSNDITNFRGFDNRHDSFTLSNVALDARWDYRGLVGRMTLQIGHTPSTYYLSEPSRPGTTAASTSNAELWKYIQQAYVGYRFGVGRGLTVSAGLFLSPVGPETMAVHDNWNWSRSNLFFGLPFYHTGVRATYELSEEWAVTLAAYNGWNSVVDDNDEKSVSAQLTFTRPEVAVSLLYFGGVERAPGAPEGRAWRNLFDAYASWSVAPWVSLMAHGNGGFESNAFGVSRWVAGALYARFRVMEQLFITARVDAFHERASSNSVGSASPIFWPAPWVSSGTATVDYRPHERLSIRLEARHDHAGGDMYFGGQVVGDGITTPFVPNRRTQNTLTLGATAWF